ncbi:MAG TPA: PTS sugar transporter subunit IIA [Thermoanaerobaculia bacterium]|jgi:mannitol/fructose-specific phosphotransferase system IIA component (Ntr-type)|nr:PTS sugar transporter subunit IIA [Thermoanaerobaculia bacterium]
MKLAQDEVECVVAPGAAIAYGIGPMAQVGVNLAERIADGIVVVPLEARTFEDAVGELLRPALARTGLGEAAIDGCIETVLRREAAGSTASGRAALPHGRCDVVSRVVAGLGLNRDGIAGRSDTKAMLAFITPQSAVVEHLHFLSAAAKLFRDEAAVERLLRAQSADEVMALLRG